MKFKTLDGRIIGVNLGKSGKSRSKSQSQLTEIIKSIYNCQVIEEFSIPGEHLFLDIFVPSSMIAFEFQGEQHDQFVAFYHNSDVDFIYQKQRDRRKREWCQLNNIRLIEVRKQDLTKEKIINLIIAD